jgi:hypothetical protein
MQIPKQRKLNTCTTGNCPPDIDLIKEIGLTPTEKRAIFFSLKEQIFKTNKLRRELLGK